MKSEEALEQIAYLEKLTAKTTLNAAYGYPYFIVWGILCALGYIGSFLLPMDSWKLLWSIISFIGITITVVVLIKQKKKHSFSPLIKRIGMQCLILFIVDYLFFGFLIHYKINELLTVYWGFQIGIIYIVASIHMSRNLTYIGLWLIITAILSHFIPINIQTIFIAITYGGGLLFTGMLFRNQIKKSETNIVE